MEQEQLVRQLRQGDSNALRELMALYTPYLCTVAANLAVPPLTAQDVEEIVSDAFIRLWRHRQDLDPNRSPKGYLVRITRNLVVDTLRSRKADCLPLVEEILEQETPLETRLEQQEAVRRLKTHLEALSPVDRELLLRFYYYNQRTAAIARELAISPGAVRVRLFRLRTQLKKGLEGEERQ